MINRRKFLSTLAVSGTIPLSNYQAQETRERTYHIGFPLEDRWERQTGFEASIMGDRVGETIFIGLSNLGTSGGALSALEYKTGEEKWSIDVESVVGAAEKHDGSLFLSTGDNTIRVNPATGEKIWTSNFSEGLGIPYVDISGDKVISSSSGASALEEGGFSYDSGELRALTMKDGEVLWSKSGKPFSVPITTDSAVYVHTRDEVYNEDSELQSSESRLYCYDINTGDELWRTRTFSPWTNPIVNESSLFSIDRSGTIFEFSASNGSQLGEYGITEDTPTAIVKDDFLYISDNSGHIISFDPVDEEIRWRKKFDKPFRWLNDGEEVLYSGETGGIIRAIDKSTGQEIWSYEMSTGAIPRLHIRGDLGFVTGEMDRIFSFSGQRAIAQDKITTARQSLSSEAIDDASDIIGIESSLQRAQTAFEEQRYDKAQSLAEKAKFHSQVTETSGIVLGALGITGSAIGIRNKFRDYRLTNKAQTKFERLSEEATELQRSSDYNLSGLDNIVSKSNPSNYDNGSDAMEAVNELWRAIQKAERFCNLAERSDEIQSKFNLEGEVIDTLLEEVSIFKNGDVDDVAETVLALEKYVDSIRAVAQERRDLRNEINDVQSEQTRRDIESALEDARKELNRQKSLNWGRDEIVNATSILRSTEQKLSLISKLQKLENPPLNIPIENLKSKVLDVKAENQPNSQKELNHLESLIEYTRQVEVLYNWDSSLPLEDIVVEINKGIEENDIDNKELDSTISELERLSKDADYIMDFIEDIGDNHPQVDADEWVNTLEEAVSEGDYDRISQLKSQIDHFRESTWEFNDLFQFNWEEFEYFIARLWSDFGYSTEVTTATNDRGIDVNAWKGHEHILIQVKQNGPRNKIGRPTVQKTMGAVMAENATKGVIVTTSSFTASAVEEAQRNPERINLVSGQELLTMVNESRLAPPN